MAVVITNKDLVVCTSEFLPTPPDRDPNTVYFVYDKMAVYMGRTFYSDPFCVVEDIPAHPAEGMLYITTGGRLKTYINDEVVDFGGTDNPEYISLITEAGTVYFMKAEYRYLDLESRCIALPFQNGTYQLSVNLMKCLKINNNTVIHYDETKGHFVIEGEYDGTSFHDTDNFVGVDTDTVKTWVEDKQLFAELKISEAANNAIKVFGNGIYVSNSGNVSREDFDNLVTLYNNYVVTVNAMMEELHQEMKDKGYDTTPEIISEMILAALEEYEPTIESMFANYQLIYDQLGYIREASLDYTDESVQALREEIFNYLNDIVNAWEEYSGETGQTIDDKTLTEEEAEYLASVVDAAREEIINSRKTELPEGAPVDFEYMYIGEPFTGQRVTPPKVNAASVYGRSLNTTYIVTYDELPTGHYYYYRFTTVAPKYLDDAVSSSYTRWMDNSDIPCQDGQSIMFAETNASKQIIKYIHLKAKSRTEYPKELATLNIHATKSYSVPGKMALSVTPALEDGNQYSYGIIDHLPEYDGIVPEGLTSWDGTSPIDLSSDNYKIITLLEHTSNGLVKKAGMVRVDLNADSMKHLSLTSNYGDTNMQTEITVYPQREPDNVYMKAFGVITPDYDAYIGDDSRFSVWNIDEPIECESYDEYITIVECSSEFAVVRAKKCGSVKAKVHNIYTAFIEYNRDEYLIDNFDDSTAEKMAYKIVTNEYSDWLNYGTVVPNDYTIVERDSVYNNGDGKFHVPFELNKKIAIATVDINNKVVQFNIVDYVVEYVVALLFSITNSGNEITINSITPDMSVAYKISKYYYQLLTSSTGKQFILNEPLDTSSYQRCTVGMTIPVVDPSFTVIRIVATDSNNRVLTSGEVSLT